MQVGRERKGGGDNALYTTNRVTTGTERSQVGYDDQMGKEPDGRGGEGGGGGGEEGNRITHNRIWRW
jgi:hypothetical protein